MNENIDLTKILKDCPIGWGFYSSIYGNVTFLGIENNSCFPIKFLSFSKDKLQRCGYVTEQGLDSPLYNGECTFFPSKNQRDWSKFTAPWYKKGKFDPKTLNAFDRVLVRNYKTTKWRCDHFSHFDGGNYNPCIASCCSYTFCVPYNDDTKHLVGTTEEAPDYYRYWDDLLWN